MLLDYISLIESKCFFFLGLWNYISFLGKRDSFWGTQLIYLENEEIKQRKGWAEEGGGGGLTFKKELIWSNRKQIKVEEKKW